MDPILGSFLYLLTGLVVTALLDRFDLIPGGGLSGGAPPTDVDRVLTIPIWPLYVCVLLALGLGIGSAVLIRLLSGRR